MPIESQATDTLSLTFAALAHPARRSILQRLGQGATSVQELSRPLAMSAPAVSRHLKILEHSGLIRRGRDAQWRPCELHREPIRQAVSWMEQLAAETEARFDRLEAYLKELQGEGATAPTTKPLK